MKWNESQIWFMLCFGISGHGGCFSSILATLFLFFFCVCLTSTNSSHNLISRHNHITFSSCLDAWWPGPSSCLLVNSYHTSIIAYVLLFETGMYTERKIKYKRRDTRIYILVSESMMFVDTKHNINHICDSFHFI